MPIENSYHVLKVAYGSQYAESLFYLYKNLDRSLKVF